MTRAHGAAARHGSWGVTAQARHGSWAGRPAGSAIRPGSAVTRSAACSAGTGTPPRGPTGWRSTADETHRVPAAVPDRRFRNSSGWGERATKYACVVRQRFVAGVLMVAVPVAAVIALFVHAHPDDHDTDHHQAHAVHAHFSGHDHHAPADGPLLTGDEGGRERAVFLGVFLGAAVASFTIVAALPPSIERVAPPEMPVRRTLQVAHGHDPPALSSLPARAPPRLPVLT